MHNTLPETATFVSHEHAQYSIYVTVQDAVCCTLTRSNDSEDELNKVKKVKEDNESEGAYGGQ